jgi:16S rRNA (cytidine1402-2'-O)-methyltransferase
MHTHNERARCADLLARLDDGAVIALVSDAGTPVLSDPGFELVRSAASQLGHEVRAIPGPTAIAGCAGDQPGIAADRFCFEGFLPARAARTTRAPAGARTRTPRDGVLRGAASHRRDARPTWQRVFGARARSRRGARTHQGLRNHLSRRARRTRVARRRPTPRWPAARLTLVVAGWLDPDADSGDEAISASTSCAARSHAARAAAGAAAVEGGGARRADQRREARSDAIRRQARCACVAEAAR